MGVLYNIHPSVGSDFDPASECRVRFDPTFCLKIRFLTLH